MLNTEGKIEFHSAGRKYKCIPRRENWQKKGIVTSKLELTQNEIRMIKDEINSKLHQDWMDSVWYKEASLCELCGEKHIRGIICQNPMDPKFISYE